MTEPGPANRSRRTHTGGAPTKSRSGSENRQRTSQIKLSLLPAEETRLQAEARRAGFRHVQEYILSRLPEIRVS